MNSASSAPQPSLLARIFPFRVVAPLLAIPAMVIFLCACEDEDDDGSWPASVDNPSSTSITSTTAVLGGRAGLGGSRPGGFEVAVSERGVIFSITSENANPQIDGTSVTKLLAATNGSGFFTVSVSGLLPSTEYSFRAFAIGQTTAYTLGVDTFTTLPPGPPTVTDPTSADNTVVSATLGGNVRSDGGFAITARGVVYAPTADNTDPLIGGTGVVNLPDTVLTTGVFTLPAKNLSPLTDYTFKAYATNSQGTSYSPAADFSINVPADTGKNPEFEGGAYDPMHVSAMAIQPDGKTLIGGSFAAVGNVVHSCLVRLNADGSVDHSFAPQVTGSAGEWVTCIAVQPDGKIVIGGNLSHVDGERHENIARLNADGSVDSSFTAAANYGFVNCLALQTDGKILLGGTFLGLNPADSDFGVGVGADYWWLGRLNADGSVDTGFNIGVEANDPNNPVNSISVMADGKIMVCGDFTTYNGVERNGLVRLKMDGTLDPSFVSASAPNDGSYCVVEQADGKIMVGGHSYVAGPGGDTTRLERLNTDGSLDSSFTSGIDDVGRITSVVLQADGKMLVCSGPSSGDITLFPGHFARLNADGSLDGTFDPGTGPNKYVEGIAIRGSGKIMACGTFTMVNGEPATGFAQFDNGEALQHLGSPDSSRVQWLRGGTAPELTQVTFDLSTDNGTSWTLLGAGTRDFLGWELSGQSLPASGMLRARGRTAGGNFNGSSGISQQVAVFPSPPLLTNLTMTDITASSAVLGSDLVPDQFYTITERGLVYALTSDNADPRIGGEGVTSVIASVTSAGVFTQMVGDLDANSNYTFRAYATNSQGTGYSSVQTFTTLGVPRVTLPTIGSQTVNVVAGDSTLMITLGGTLASDAGLPVTERGVVYSQSLSIPVIDQPGVSRALAAGTDLGAFTTTVDGLAPGSQWFFRAYAKNEAGVSYSPVAEFFTHDVPRVRIEGGEPTSSTSALLQGRVISDGGLPITGFGAIYGIVSQENRLQTKDTIDPITVPGSALSSGTFDVSITGLEPGVTYAYSVYADNALGRDRGELQYLEIPLPGAAFDEPPSRDEPPVSGDEAPPEAGYDPNIPHGFVQALAVQPDGKVIIGGEFDTVSELERRALARLNTDGSVDASFTPGTDGNIYSVVVQEDGKILIGGIFSEVNNQPRNGIARLNADGTLESSTTFNIGTGTDNFVYSIVLQPDGKILLGGMFDKIQGQTKNRIARLNADGSVDGSFDPGSGADDSVYSVALQSDGKILLGGAFENVADTARGGIARLNTNGSLDTTFAPGSGADDKVDAIIVQPDGKILIGGYFTTINGTARKRVARLTSTGTLDPTFDPGTGLDGNIYSMVLQVDGKILLGGSFQNVNGTARNRIARLNADGSHDTSFDPGAGANGEVDGIALQADGNILLGGGFTEYDATPRNRIARIDNDVMSQSLTITTAAQAQWLRGGAGPEVSTVAFQVSTDGGNTWSHAGSGTRVAGGWQATGLSLPPNGTLRAVGRTAGGFLTASSGLVSESAVFAFDPGEIRVEQSLAGIFTSGETLAFGGVLNSSFAQRTFTIRNIGPGHLAGLQIRIDGLQASQFTLDTVPATSLATSGATTFVVRFTPSIVGIKTAQLHIASNDPDESSFEINLTGIGASPQGIWRQTHFGSVSNSDTGADLFDFDQDGMTNIMEYAFGLTPTLASSMQLPGAQQIGDNFGFNFTEPAGVSGIIYGAQWSTTLKPGEWTDIPDTGNSAQHIFSVPISGDAKKYFRLTVFNP